MSTMTHPTEAYAAARTRELVEVLTVFYQHSVFPLGKIIQGEAAFEKARALLATHQPTKEA